MRHGFHHGWRNFHMGLWCRFMVQALIVILPDARTIGTRVFAHFSLIAQFLPDARVRFMS
jgi:hypothetical protein